VLIYIFLNVIYSCDGKTSLHQSSVLHDPLLLKKYLLLLTVLCCWIFLWWRWSFYFRILWWKESFKSLEMEVFCNCNI